MVETNETARDSGFGRCLLRSGATHVPTTSCGHRRFAVYAGALSYTVALAPKRGASVHVFHANLFQVGGRGFTELTESEATELVDAAVAQLREQGLTPRGSVAPATCFSIGQIVADAALIVSATSSFSAPVDGRGCRACSGGEPASRSPETRRCRYSRLRLRWTYLSGIEDARAPPECPAAGIRHRWSAKGWLSCWRLMDRPSAQPISGRCRTSGSRRCARCWERGARPTPGFPVARAAEVPKLPGSDHAGDGA